VTLWHVASIGLVDVGGYAPFMLQTSLVQRREDGSESLRQVAAVWSDYTRTPEGLWLPCGFRSGSFSTDLEGVLRLESGQNVAVIPSSVGPAEGRLTDEQLADWCPLGALVLAAPEAEGLLPQSVAAAWAERSASATMSSDWATAPLETLVFGMDQPLFTAPLAERWALAEGVCEEIKRSVEAHQ